jgi:general secretion pathway protein C
MLFPASSARKLRPTERWSGPGALAPSLAAGVLWLLAALVTIYWVLQIWGRGPLMPVVAMAGNPPMADPVAVGRALGAVPEAPAAQPVAPPLSSRFRLVGLVGQPAQRGAALIAVDGQPPRPVAVGAAVEGELRLLSVGRNTVRLGMRAGDPAAFELSLPEQTQ